MKKLHLIILLLAVTLGGMAQTIGEAFYIYRNDGQFNVFFRDEVQSIEYSYADEDGNTYDEIVTQIVTTADSIYKIPLAAIDSVGFVHPRTIYKENVIPMEGELMDYLVCVDGLTLTFMPTLPNSLTPQEGTKLVELGLTDIFPHGFLGNVSKVIKTSEEITVKCDSIMLEDAVSRFYGSYKLEGKKSSKSRRAAYIDTYHKSLNLEPFSKKISLSDLVAESEVMELSVDNSIFEINAKRFVDIFLTISIDDRLEIDRYDAHIETTLDSEVKYDFCGGISGGPSVEVAIPDIPIVPGITFYMHPGAKLEGTGEVALGFTWTPVLEHVLNLEIYPKDLLKSKVTKNALNLQDSHFDWRYLAGTATFKTAATLELGFGLGNSNFIKVGGELDFGIKEDINYTFNIEDLSKDKKNQVYNLIYDMNKIDLTMYLGTYFVVSALGDDSPWNIAWKPGKDWDLLKIYEGRFFPSFDNVTIKRDEANSHIINAGSDISNDCFLPVTVGYILFDSDDNYIDTWYKDDANYWNRISSFHRYEHQFNGIDLTKSYKVYPCIKIFDKYDMIASPYAELKPISAKVVKFNMTKVQYSKAAFVNDNQNYDFCYNAAITVELENTESVEDWGYVYEDPNHQIKHISLKGHESPYTDTNYAFYRNAPTSTACLYGYVKYQGDENYYYGEKTDYPLVYDKQPEAITKEVSEVSATNAKVKCEYKEAAPWGGVCGVEYWKDPDHHELFFETANEEIEITLNNLSPNTTYYYRAFIKVGDKYYRAEETKSFTTQSPVTNLCPDENHPHLIDLGLPSGTKWACCNVGASSPGQHGGYYGWGDTNVKSYYWWDTLPYFVAWNGDNCIFNDIGSNIAGSSYDVAHVCWGGKWSMPTLDMIKELVENCDYQGGSSGLYFTGPNGNSIFIPFGGIITGDAYFFEDEAWLWSSTNAQHSNMDDAYILRCAQDNLSAYYSQTSYYAGCNVRPVQPGITVKTSEATDVKVVSATLNGKVDNYEALEGTVTYAFCYSTDEDVMNSFNVRTITATDDGNGNFSATIDDLEIETQYYYYAYIQKGEDKFFGDVMSFITNSLCPDENHPHMIDLGLPSGIKWACCNVGASNPRERGGYYAWGETFEKSSYSWESYTLYDINRTENAGYFDIAVDISGTDYDVAHVKWGSKWKMPSKTDFEELIANCGTKTITYYNDIFGYSNDYSILLIGSNGKAIILPQTGLRQDERPITDFGGLYYWSSTRDTRTKTGSMTASSGYRDAFYLGGWSSLSMGDCNRTQGFPIRPMWKE